MKRLDNIPSAGIVSYANAEVLVPINKLQLLNVNRKDSVSSHTATTATDRNLTARVPQAVGQKRCKAKFNFKQYVHKNKSRAPGRPGDKISDGGA